jgi:hypothetical protein
MVGLNVKFSNVNGQSQAVDACKVSVRGIELRCGQGVETQAPVTDCVTGQDEPG